MKMKKQRLAFAKKHAHWTTEHWRKVTFSNESNFQVFKMGSTTVWHPRSSDCFDSQYTVPTVKHLQSVMIWGCFLGERKGRSVLSPKEQKNECRSLSASLGRPHAQLLQHLWL